MTVSAISGFTASDQAFDIGALDSVTSLMPGQVGRAMNLLSGSHYYYIGGESVLDPTFPTVRVSEINNSIVVPTTGASYASDYGHGYFYQDGSYTFTADGAASKALGTADQQNRAVIILPFTLVYNAPSDSSFDLYTAIQSASTAKARLAISIFGGYEIGRAHV